MSRRKPGSRSAPLLLLVVCLAFSGVAEGEGPPFAFDEVAVESGLEFVHQRAVTTRLWFPEIMSGGGGWLDYDGDGDLDAYLVQGGELDPARPPGPGDRLFRNDDGVFRDTSRSALRGPSGYGMGLAIGDYDGDGATDIYVTRVGPNLLLRNRGDGTFEDVTGAAGVGDQGWGTSAAFLDYDGDDRLDLFVVNYIDWDPANEIECWSGGRLRDYCHPSNYNAPAPDTLYRNRGDGSFENVTAASGLRAFFGNGLGVAVADFDDNGRPDLFVANDGMANQLWLNQDGARFVNDAVLAGCAVNRAGIVEAGMGVVAADLDGDLRTDLFMTHLRDETNTLYVNQGGWFDDRTASQGLAAPSIGLTGFGAGAADFDHDGELDLFVANGKVGRDESPGDTDDPFAEPNQFFRGLGDGRFEEARASADDGVETSRGAAFGDYDRDGRVDILVVNNGGPARLLRNRAADAGWLRVRAMTLEGLTVLGTLIDVRTAGTTRRWRLESASSYCSSNEPAAHFGLGAAAAVDAIEARWPSGRRQRWIDVPTSREISVYRPRQTATAR